VIEDNMTATGDPVLLRVLLENLLDNAWKFTARIPQPRIEFGVECSRYGEGFFVRDNGVGFDMEHAARLFAPFQRLPSATGFSGTGIGLATVQRIIARLGGRIWAESAPGAGATFHFTLGAMR
jgi:signal transduction histidine kinase